MELRMACASGGTVCPAPPPVGLPLSPSWDTSAVVGGAPLLLVPEGAVVLELPAPPPPPPPLPPPPDPAGAVVVVLSGGRVIDGGSWAEPRAAKAPNMATARMTTPMVRIRAIT